MHAHTRGIDAEARYDNWESVVDVLQYAYFDRNKCHKFRCNYLKCERGSTYYCKDCGAHFCDKHNSRIHSINLLQFHRFVKQMMHLDNEHVDSGGIRTKEIEMKCICTSRSCIKRTHVVELLVIEAKRVAETVGLIYCTCFSLSVVFMTLNVFPLTPVNFELGMSLKLLSGFIPHFRYGKESAYAYVGCTLTRSHNKITFYRVYDNFFTAFLRYLLYIHAKV